MRADESFKYNLRFELDLPLVRDDSPRAWPSQAARVLGGDFAFVLRERAGAWSCPAQVGHQTPDLTIMPVAVNTWPRAQPNRSTSRWL